MARRVWVFVSLLLAISELHGQTLPSSPSKLVDTTFPTMSGNTINVAAGGDLQAAINQAQYGDTIKLAAGATFSGSFTLPVKSGTGWIVIRTSAPDTSLPAQGQRITPSFAASMPKIVATSSSPAIATAPSAHNYRLVGLEITVASGVSLNYGLVTLGDGDPQTSLSQVPNGFILDRVYIHGQTSQALRRGVAFNASTCAVIDSYISEVHDNGADSQAIGGWNGPGPFKISNNYLSAAGENVMFGGGDPSITNLVPSDIEIRGNYFFKPTSWQTSSWVVKNLLELKNAQRVLVDGNVFEHNWPSGQNGYSILFTTRNQDGTAPWSVVQDVTFTHNIARHISSGVNILGFDDLNPSQQTKRILIANNVFDDVSSTNWGGLGRLFQLISGTANVTINHNTAFQSDEVIASGGQANTGFTYTNNITPNNLYGVGGDSYYGNPNGALATYFPGYVFRRNILQGGDSTLYPPDNFFPATIAAIGFVNFSGGDYHLASSSAYKNAGTDGKDVGADIDSVNSATAGAISGNSITPPPPPPSDTTPPTVAITAPAAAATVSGTVTVSANASDNVGVAGVQFFMDNAALGAEVLSAPYSTSWNTTAATNGSHSLTARARDAAGNTRTSAAVTVTVSNSAPPPPQQAPYTGTPISIPGTFEAENFDLGGEGVAYHDNVPGNAGGQYRPNEDVDIIALAGGGFAVNNFETGEWLEYTINVAATANYNIQAFVSSEMTTGQFHVSIDGVDQTGVISVPNTGLWSTYEWVGKDGVSLKAGQHVLRVTVDSQYFNFDKMQITADAPPADTTPPSVSITSPAPNATVSGSITVTASASDNVGVAGVQFLLDGSALGAEDTAAPYQLAWDTTKVSNGSHSLVARARDAAGNSTPSASVTVTVSNAAPAPQQTPYYGTPFAVPGSFAAVDFDKGGEGVAYHDNVPGNAGGQYRPNEDVDIIQPTAGVYVVDNFETGEWLEYSISVSSSGSYKIEAYVSSEYSNAQFNVSIDGTDVTGLITAPNTGYWGTFAWVGKDGINLTAGTHILRVTTDMQYFNFEQMRISASAPPADTTPPSVSITNPASGATVAATVTVSASASDNVGVVGVQLLLDGSPLGAEDLSAPFQASWDTTKSTNGTHTLTARARDAAGNSTTSAAVTVTVSNAPPKPARSPFYGTPFAVPGSFKAVDFDKGGEGVAYHDNVPGNAGGQYRPTEDVDIIQPSTGLYVVNNFETGEWLEYTINVGSTGSYSIQLFVSSEFSNAQFHVSIDGTDVTGLIAAPNTGLWTTFAWVGKTGVSLTAGQHILRVTTDVQYFNFQSVSITQQIVDSPTNPNPAQPAPPALDTTAPTVSISAPSNNATVVGMVQISALASDDTGVAGVQFYVDGIATGFEDTTAPFSAAWDTTTTANGMHTLTAIARDAAGNKATAAAVTVNVLNSPPVVTITAPSTGTTVGGTVKIAATAPSASVGVRFYVDGVQVGIEDNFAPFQASWDTSKVLNGTHVITATSRDLAGNINASQMVTVTVSNGATGRHPRR